MDGLYWSCGCTYEVYLTQMTCLCFKTFLLLRITVNYKYFAFVSRLVFKNLIMIKKGERKANDRITLKSDFVIGCRRNSKIQLNPTSEIRL